MKRLLKFLILPLMIVFSLAIVMLAQAAVDLVSFDAIPDVANQKIVLIWETASELEFAGFFVQRRLSPDTDFIRISPLQPAQGIGGGGAQYDYEDTNVEMGVMYYYRLEMLDLGNNSDYSDVKSAILENSPTPTATPSPTTTSDLTATPSPTGTSGPTTTQTRTATLTPTSALSSTTTPTRTKTRHPTFTLTRTPSPFHVVTYTSRPRATSTLTETPTNTSTPTISPTVTTTLAPLPSLTLLFPARTHTSTITPSPTFTPSPIPPSPSPTPKPDNHIPLQISFLGGIILLLWIILAGFLIAYLRRISN